LGDIEADIFFLSTDLTPNCFVENNCDDTGNYDRACTDTLDNELVNISIEKPDAQLVATAVKVRLVSV
jgi:hypothetical protein